MMCLKYDSFCFSIRSSNVRGGIIYSSTHLFVLLVVIRIFHVCLQHYISKLSIFFFTVNDSHPCIATGHTEHSPASSWLLLSHLCVSRSFSILTLLYSTMLNIYQFIFHFNLRNQENETFHYFHMIISKSEHISVLS